jgi:hypothetical protein
MCFNSVIKILFCIVFCLQLQSQNDSLSQTSDVSKIKFLFDESRQYLGSVSIAYQSSIPYGENFIGKGFERDGGFSFDFSFYVFKNFFIGFNYGINEFENINRELLGNYKETEVEERYFKIGYEFLPLKRVRLGINTSIGGEATLSNKSGLGFSNRDSGKLWSYGFRLEYEIIKNANLSVAYNWRRIKTNIQTPSALVPFFDKGTYNTLNFGFKSTANVFQ